MAKTILPEAYTSYSIYPYASYHSNVANQAKRIVTLGINCIIGGLGSLDVVADETYPYDPELLTIQAGRCVIDDVLIELSNDINLDLSNIDNYVASSGALIEDGYYYVCLKYVYSKSKPAPSAYVQVLKPSELDIYVDNGSYLILKIIDIDDMEIIGLYNYDSNTPINRRIYPKNFCELYNSIPDYNYDTDLGRMICVEDNDAETITYYFGFADAWGLISSGSTSGGVTQNLIESEEHPTATDWDYELNALWVVYSDEYDDRSQSQVYILIQNDEDDAVWHSLSGFKLESLNPTPSSSVAPNGGYWVNKNTGEIFLYNMCADSDINLVYGDSFNWTQLRRKLLHSITVYLDPTDGNDNEYFPLEDAPFQTSSRMMEFLNGYDFNEDITVTIIIKDGLAHNIYEDFKINHPQSHLITVKGETTGTSKNFNTIENIGVSGEDGYILKITLDEELEGEELTVSSYVLIYDCESSNLYTTQSYALAGCWQISEITSATEIKIVWRGNLTYGNNVVIPPEGEIFGKLVEIKTIISCNNCNGIVVDNFNALNQLSDMVLIGGSVGVYQGINLPNEITMEDDYITVGGGSIKNVTNLGITGFNSDGISIGHGSSLKGTLIVSNKNVKSGLLNRGYLHIANLVLSHNGINGISNEGIYKGYKFEGAGNVSNNYSGDINSNGSVNYVFVGNSNNGCYVNRQSSFIILSEESQSINNASTGFYSLNSSLIECNSTESFYNVNGYISEINSKIICNYSKSYENTYGYIAHNNGIIEANQLSWDLKDDFDFETYGSAVISTIFDTLLMENNTTAIPEDIYTCYNNYMGFVSYKGGIIIAENTVCHNTENINVYCYDKGFININTSTFTNDDAILYDAGNVSDDSYLNMEYCFIHNFSIGIKSSIKSKAIANNTLITSCTYGFYASNEGYIQCNDSNSFGNTTGYIAYNSIIEADRSTTFKLNYSDSDDYDTLEEDEQGNSEYGFYISDNSSLHAEDSRSFGNTLSGFYINNGSKLFADNSESKSNSENGYVYLNRSMGITDSSIADSNNNSGYVIKYNSFLQALSSQSNNNGQDTSNELDDPDGYGYDCQVMSTCIITDAIIDTCTMGLYANIKSYIDFEDGTFTDCDTDMSPSTDMTLGNNDSYINYPIL